MNTFLLIMLFGGSDQPWQAFSVKKGCAMENMPFFILLGIGGLLVVVVILFVIAQKKQKKTSDIDESAASDTLKIELKNAADDIDDTAASLETETRSAEKDKSPDPKPEAEKPVKKPEAEKVPETEKTMDAEAESSDQTEADTADDSHEQSLDDVMGNFGDMMEPAFQEDVQENVQEAVVAEAMEEDDDDSMTMDDLDMIASEVQSVVAEPGIVPAADSIDPSAPEPSDDAMDNIFETGEEDMSELEALFGASTDVEDHVMSGIDKDEGDILEDLQDSDYLSAAPKAPEVTENMQESEPLRAIQPKPKPEPTPPPPPPKPAEPDPEEQKRHDKAKRIARVIVNDIRNYNPDKLAEGIRMGGIMKTLGKEVERGRLLYIKRVPPEITRETNYYREALIKILADGQPDLLGL